jgi:hypothetical protein
MEMINIFNHSILHAAGQGDVIKDLQSALGPCHTKHFCDKKKKYIDIFIAILCAKMSRVTWASLRRFYHMMKNVNNPGMPQRHADRKTLQRVEKCASSHKLSIQYFKPKVLTKWHQFIRWDLIFQIKIYC